MSTVRVSSRLLSPLALAGLTGLTAVALVLPGAAPARAADFSTNPVEAAPTGTAQTVVSAVNVGHHPGFDRLVFTFTGPLPGYSVAYVPQVAQDASGHPVALQGSSFALVTLRSTSTTTHAPQQTVTPHLPMLRQVAGAGDFEAVTSYGVGLAARSGMRVLTLTGPNRLVVDFAIPGGTATATPADTSVAPVGSPAPGGEGTVTPAATTPAPGTGTSAAAADPGSDADNSPGGPSAGALTAGGVGLVALGAGGYLLFRRRPI